MRELEALDQAAEDAMPANPVAIAMTLCDYVLVEEGSKKVSLIGNFTRIAATRFPALTQPFSVFAVLTDGVGDVTMELVVAHMDTTEEELFSYRNRLTFPDKLAEVSFHLRLRQFTFPAPGVYQFTLLAAGQWVAHRRLEVYMRENQP